MARLSVQLFGSFHAHLDGKEITRFESDKVRAFLAYLIMESDQAHRREKLMALFWPELPESHARQNLRRVLYNLRSAIRDQQGLFLAVNTQTIQFDPSSDHWLDTAAFTALLNEVESHNHRSLAGCDPCLGKLKEAIGLYRGDFLEAFSVVDSPSFDEWVLLKREHFNRRVIAKLEDLVYAYQRRNENEALLEVAKRLVELDPWNETGHRGVMIALTLRGQRNAALAQYEACCSILMDELGVDPESATTVLYERIRDGDELAKETRLPPNNLPAVIPSYVERKEIENKIKEYLGDLGCRLCTLVGPGGSGKTLLAVKVARDMLRQFENGVFFVPLESLDSIEEMVPALANALGFSFYEGLAPRKQMLNYLGSKSMLLILDNYEHLLDGFDLAVDILQAAPNVVILTTSRVRLNVQAEHILDIPGMNYPQWDTSIIPADISIDNLGYDALKLITQSARRVKADFRLDHSNIKQAVGICELVNGMPLGIVMAASWLKMLSLAEIIDEIQGKLDFLATDLRDIPERHRSIQAVFDHSWGLLGAEEKRGFRSLCVFRGSFTSKAVRQISGASRQHLMTLVNRSFLQHDTDGRFHIHRLLRQYGTQKLEQLPEEYMTLKNRHCAYYTGLLEVWGEDLKGSKQLESFEQIKGEIQNARNAWEWAVENEQVYQIDRALDGLCHFYSEWQTDLTAGEEICRQAASKLIEMAGLQINEEDTFNPLESGEIDDKEAIALILRTLSRVLTWQGMFCITLGHENFAYQLLQRSFSLLDQPFLASYDVRKEKAYIMQSLGEFYQKKDLAKARAYYKESLSKYRSLKDLWKIADILAKGSDYSTNDLERRIEILEECLSIYQASGDRKKIAQAMGLLSNCLARLGRNKESIQVSQNGLAILREMGNHYGIATNLGELGAALFYNGEYEEARRSFIEQIEMVTELGLDGRLSICHMIIGHAELHLGMYTGVHQHAKLALDYAWQQNNLLWVGYSNYLLGVVYLVEGNYKQAQEALEEGIIHLMKQSMKDSLGATIAALGFALLKMGDLHGARRRLNDAMNLAAETDAMYPFLWSLPGIALLFVDEGQVARGVELYSQAESYPRVANSKWFDDIVGQHIRKAAAGLSSEEVEAAQARGKARDRVETIKELLQALSAESTSERQTEGME